VRRLDAKGWIKPRWKRNTKVKIKCVMRNNHIDGLTTNRSPTPLPEQERLWALDADKMESSSKINLRDVSWWMCIKDAYTLGVSITTKFSKKRCISLAIKRPSCATYKHDWNKCGPPSTWETYSSKPSLLKIQNLQQKYRVTKAQHLKKADGAHRNEGLYHQKILVVELDASLKGLKRNPIIMDP